MTLSTEQKLYKTGKQYFNIYTLFTLVNRFVKKNKHKIVKENFVTMLTIEWYIITQNLIKICF